MGTAGLEMPMTEVARICRRHHVRELALFGSAARGDSTLESDLDLLVDFEPGAEVGFLAMAGMQRELSSLLGRKVDLVPARGLKPMIRNAVLAEAEVVYEA